MSVNISISELKQRTGSVLSRAVENREDIVVERYGRGYAVLLSAQRYRELLDAAQHQVSERMREAQDVVYAATAEIPLDEIEEMVHGAIEASRRERAI